MKKLNWFTRLFMSFDQLKEYFNQDNNDAQTVDTVKELYESRVKELSERNDELKNSVTILNDKLTRYEQDIKNKEENFVAKDNDIHKLKTEIEGLRVRLEERNNENKLIKDDIRDQLVTIGKIEKTFFSNTGNKGKGELGERQVKTILEKSGLDRDMWEENITVGSKSVEFGMKSGEEGKFIPIDSKVLDAQLDEDGHIVIDDKYKNKVATQAKSVSEYLGKKNTADYGVLVLQGDDLYIKLFEEYPTFFNEMIDKHRVFIMSPSTFIQTAYSISNIIKIYKRVKNDEEIYDEIRSALDTTAKFAKSLEKTHADFNKAMNSHYPALAKKHTALVKKLEKEGKTVTINEIDFKKE